MQVLYLYMYVSSTELFMYNSVVVMSMYMYIAMCTFLAYYTVHVKKNYMSTRIFIVLPRSVVYDNILSITL